MIGRDQRAVVIRCTATNITPADEIDVKKSQPTSNDCQARSGCTKRPMMKTINPIAASTSEIVLSIGGDGRSMPTRTSSRDRACGSWPLMACFSHAQYCSWPLWNPGAIAWYQPRDRPERQTEVSGWLLRSERRARRFVD